MSIESSEAQPARTSVYSESGDNMCSQHISITQGARAHASLALLLLANRLVAHAGFKDGVAKTSVAKMFTGASRSRRGVQPTVQQTTLSRARRARRARRVGACFVGTRLELRALVRAR